MIMKKHLIISFLTAIMLILILDSCVSFTASSVVQSYNASRLGWKVGEEDLFINIYYPPYINKDNYPPFFLVSQKTPVVELSYNSTDLSAVYEIKLENLGDFSIGAISYLLDKKNKNKYSLYFGGNIQFYNKKYAISRLENPYVISDLAFIPSTLPENETVKLSDIDRLYVYQTSSATFAVYSLNSKTVYVSEIATTTSASTGLKADLNQDLFTFSGTELIFYDVKNGEIKAVSDINKDGEVKEKEKDYSSYKEKRFIPIAFGNEYVLFPSDEVNKIILDNFATPIFGVAQPNVDVPKIYENSVQFEPGKNATVTIVFKSPLNSPFVDLYYEDSSNASKVMFATYGMQITVKSPGTMYVGGSKIEFSENDMQANFDIPFSVWKIVKKSSVADIEELLLFIPSDYSVLDPNSKYAFNPGYKDTYRPYVLNYDFGTYDYKDTIMKKYIIDENYVGSKQSIDKKVYVRNIENNIEIVVTLSATIVTKSPTGSIYYIMPSSITPEKIWYDRLKGKSILKYPPKYYPDSYVKDVIWQLTGVDRYGQFAYLYGKNLNTGDEIYAVYDIQKEILEFIINPSQENKKLEILEMLKNSIKHE